MIAALLLAAALPSPSPAPSPAPPATIGTVTVVTGSAEQIHRAPQPVGVLDRRALRAGNGVALDAALAALPGFDRDRSLAAFTNYGQTRLSFAGTGADRGALVVDGIPAGDGFGGQIDWNAYPLVGVTRAELLRGPGSALYGSGAIGGVLSLTTLAPVPGAAGTVELAEGGVLRDLAAAALVLPAGAWSTSVVTSTERASLRVAPPGQTTRVDHPAVSRAQVARLRARRTIGAGTLDLGIAAADDAQDEGRPNVGFSRNLDEATAAYATRAGAASLRVAGFDRAARVFPVADRYPAAPGSLLYRQRVDDSDAGGSVRLDAPLGGAALTLLAERRAIAGESRQSDARGALQSDVAGRQTLDGGALQIAFGGRLGGVAGARWDRITTRTPATRENAAVSPRVALRYDLSPALAVRAAYGTGLRAPFLNELLRSYRVGAVTAAANPLLVPERSRSGQAGIDVALAGGRFALDETSTAIVDAIGFRTLSATLQRRANLGRARADATAAEYTRDLGCTRLRAAATLDHDRVVSGPGAGKRLAYVPDATAGLDVERTVGALTAGLVAHYSGPTFADDLERQPLGTRVALGARLALHAADGTTITLALDDAPGSTALATVDRLTPPTALTLRIDVPVGGRRASLRPACAP